MAVNPDDRRAELSTHSAECAECRDTPLPIDRIAAMLERSAPAIDVAALSQQTFARLQPELQRRAATTAWRRVAIGVLAALLPLPVVLAYNAYVLRLAYDLLSTLLPTTLAAYMVISYGAFLVLLFAATYAAIPLLVVRRSIERRAAAA